MADAAAEEDNPRSLKNRMVKLIARDGHTFWVDRRCCMISGTIKAMLEGQFAESTRNEITFPEISAVVLEKVIQYMVYKVKYSNSTQRIPEFPIEPELALSLLMSANYLLC